MEELLAKKETKLKTITLGKYDPIFMISVLPVNTVTGRLVIFQATSSGKNNQRTTVTKSGWAHFDIYLS